MAECLLNACFRNRVIFLQLLHLITPVCLTVSKPSGICSNKIFVSKCDFGRQIFRPIRMQAMSFISTLPRFFAPAIWFHFFSLARFPTLRFWWCRVFHSCVFSLPTISIRWMAFTNYTCRTVVLISSRKCTSRQQNKTTDIKHVGLLHTSHINYWRHLSTLLSVQSRLLLRFHVNPQ